MFAFFRAGVAEGLAGATLVEAAGAGADAVERNLKMGRTAQGVLGEEARTRAAARNMAAGVRSGDCGAEDRYEGGEDKRDAPLFAEARSGSKYRQRVEAGSFLLRGATAGCQLRLKQA